MNAPETLTAARPGAPAARGDRSARLGTDPHAGRLRHHEPGIESRADRMAAPLFRSAWGRLHADLRRREAQGQPVRDAARARRQRDDRRRRAVRPYGRRPGGRPAVGHEPVRGDAVGDRVFGRGVTDMKSFSATGLAFVPEFLRRGLDAPGAFRVVLRRGDRLRRRAAADRRHRPARHQAAGLHRGRTDRHGARRRAQGQEELALPRPRPRSALVAHSARRQRRADRL